MLCYGYRCGVVDYMGLEMALQVIQRVSLAFPHVVPAFAFMVYLRVRTLLTKYVASNVNMLSKTTRSILGVFTVGINVPSM